MTNKPNLINKLEPSAPKDIMVEFKMRTDVSLLYGGMGEIVTTEKIISRKKVI